MTRIAYPFIDKTTLASNLRAAIQSSGKTSLEVANQASVRSSHLSRFLSTGAGISPDGIERIARVIGVDLATIYTISRIDSREKVSAAR